jgi:hypothetical protein
MFGGRNANGSMKTGSDGLGGGLLGELSVYFGELSDIFPAASIIVKKLSDWILLCSFSFKFDELTGNGMAVPRCAGEVRGLGLEAPTSGVTKKRRRRSNPDQTH